AGKMAFACLCLALANVLMAVAAWSAGAGAGAKAGPAWLVGYFILVTTAELHLAPVGLALVSTVAPVRLRSMMMGLWSATTFPADILGGWLGGFWTRMNKVDFYLMIAAVAALAGVAIWALTSTLKSIFDE